MALEIVGHQLRIRVLDPTRFKKFRVLDPGERGRLQIVRGLDPTEGFITQSYRMNLKMYSGVRDAARELKKLNIPKSRKQMALVMLQNYYSKLR